MDYKIIEYSQNLNRYNLNFILDNFKVTIHNFMAETFQYVDGYDYHQHSSYELHYIKKGYGTISFNNVEYKLKKGDLCLLLPNTKHKQVIYNNSMIEYALRFSIEKLQNSSKDKTTLSESEYIINLLKDSSNQIFPNKILFEEFFEKSFEEAYHLKPGYFVTIKQNIMNIIINIARLSYKDDNTNCSYHFPTRSTEVAQIEAISEFIRDNITSNITNKLISDYIHMSERQLYRLVKKKTGLSPHQYVLQIRINYVKKLLCLNIYTLKTISEMAGFSSEYHLSTAFKKFTGLSPTEYLRKLEDLYKLDENSNQKTVQLY